MAQAEPRSTTRRAIVGAFVAAGVAAPASTAIAVQTSPSDAEFQTWWSEMDALEHQIEVAPQETDADQNAIDRMADRAGDLQDLILQTPSSTRIAVELKLRTLIGYFGNYDAPVVAPAKDILTFIISHH